jgi:hypothetical protein
MVALGVRRGVPDLCLPVPVATAHGTAPGLWVELKHASGTPSQHQQRWLRTLAAHGYAIALAWTYDDACDAIDAYLTGDGALHTASALALIGDGPMVA